MIELLRIRGFRALKNFELQFPPGRLVVLIGENASGKSTVLDALQVLAAFADGRGGEALADRGGWNALCWQGSAQSIELSVRFSQNSAFFERENSSVEYVLELRSQRGIPTVHREEILLYKQGLEAKPFIALRGGEGRRFVANVQTRANDPAPEQSATGRLLVDSTLAQVTDQTRYPTPQHVREALRSVAFYPGFSLSNVLLPGEGNAEPFGARPVERVLRIKRNGRDLLNVLHTLSQEFPDVWRELQRDLRAVFPWCTAMSFPPGPARGMLTLTWKDQRSGALLYLDDMSEGMRVYLALLAALHMPDSPVLLAFDEPERSLHPRAQKRIVKVLEARAERTPTIVATHSDRLLDWLEDPLASLRILRYSNEQGATAAALDAELLDQWRKEYSLSELRARDLLDGVVEEAS